MYILSHITSLHLDNLLTQAVDVLGHTVDSSDSIVAKNILIATNYIAYIEQSIASECAYCLKSEDFIATLNIILNASYYYGCIGIEFNRFRISILMRIIQLKDSLPLSLQSILLECIKEKSHLYDDVLLFNTYYEFLVNCGDTNSVQVYYDTWMNKEGLIWEYDLSKRDIIGNVLIDIAVKLQWNDKVNEAKNLLNVRSTGYVGRKDYSLYTPLNWFKRLAKNSPDLWKQEGILLLNISKYASDIGDNRATVQIEGEIASAAGKVGPDSLFEYFEMVRKKDSRWEDNIFDGIIASMETASMSEQNLLEIWRIATMTFRINMSAERYDYNNTRNKIYLADLHYAISLCANRLGFLEIEEELKKIAPVEYQQKRLDKSEHSHIIPVRWFESKTYPDMLDFISKTDTMDVDEMFDFIQALFQDRKEISWNYVEHFLKRIKKGSPNLISKYKSAIICMLKSRNKRYTLESDGSYNVYLELFQYMNNEEVESVLSEIIDTYYTNIDDGFNSTEYGLMTNLDNFSFLFFTNIKAEDNRNALQEILKMHCMWLCGTEDFSLSKIFEVGANKQDVADWNEFCDKLKILIN